MVYLSKCHTNAMAPYRAQGASPSVVKLIVLFDQMVRSKGDKVISELDLFHILLKDLKSLSPVFNSVIYCINCE